MKDLEELVQYVLKKQAESVGQFRDLQAALEMVEYEVTLISSYVDDYRKESIDLLQDTHDILNNRITVTQNVIDEHLDDTHDILNNRITITENLIDEHLDDTDSE